jgi:hypothetical protein
MKPICSYVATNTPLGFAGRIFAFMEEQHPLLTKRAGGRDISGLSAYEQ